MNTVTDPEDKELTAAGRAKLAHFVLGAIAWALLTRIPGERKIRNSSLRSRGALRGIRLIDKASLDAYIESFATKCSERREGKAAA